MTHCGTGRANARLARHQRPAVHFGHAEALADEIPDARLVALEGVGHQMPPPAAWDLVVTEILRHTSGGWGQEANRLAAESLAAGDATGWFERLYTAAEKGQVPTPWDRNRPHRLLAHWMRTSGVTGTGRRALVVGCGLGADAEYVAGFGFETVAFDISVTAIQFARARHPDSTVTYRTADVLDPPTDWSAAFDLVVEVYTVQALPDPPRRQAIQSITSMVATGGTLVVVAFAGDDADPRPECPPWPLTRAEIDVFAAGCLDPVNIETHQDPDDPAVHFWLAEFQRASTSAAASASASSL